MTFGQIDISADGRCYASDTTPAVIQTITEQLLTTPERTDAAGNITSAATFRTNTRQQIVRERMALRFETLCPPQYTAERVETLQRAFKARGIYTGPINGILDRATGEAIRRFQRQNGLDSPFLDIRTARALGIIALSADQLAAN